MVSKPWRQAETDTFLANHLRNGRDHIQHEARIDFWGTAVLVRAVIRSFFEELINKVPIRAVNLNAIKARTLDPPSCGLSLGRGTSPAETYSKEGSSLLSCSIEAARPSDQSCKYMYDPFAWTASVT